MLAEIALFHIRIRPDCQKQLVFAHNPLSILHQVSQNVKGLGAKRNRLPQAQAYALGEVDLEFTEKKLPLIFQRHRAFTRPVESDCGC